MISFPYQGLSTYPRFETEARGNSEMAYWDHKQNEITSHDTAPFEVMLYGTIRNDDF